MVYKIIRVDKIIPSHPASFSEDYSMMLSAAKNKLSMEAIEKFLNEKISTTYITIDPLFADCEFEHPGLSEKIRYPETSGESRKD